MRAFWSLQQGCHNWRAAHNIKDLPQSCKQFFWFTFRWSLQPESSVMCQNRVFLYQGASFDHWIWCKMKFIHSLYSISVYSLFMMLFWDLGNGPAVDKWSTRPHRDLHLHKPSNDQTEYMCAVAFVKAVEFRTEPKSSHFQMQNSLPTNLHPELLLEWLTVQKSDLYQSRGGMEPLRLNSHKLHFLSVRLPVRFSSWL